jgi:hypothetical protein
MSDLDAVVNGLNLKALVMFCSGRLVIRNFKGVSSVIWRESVDKIIDVMRSSLHSSRASNITRQEGNSFPTARSDLTISSSS